MGCFTAKNDTKTTSGLTGPQIEGQKQALQIYTPFLGKGTLGGLSDLEQSAVNMLKGAGTKVWSSLKDTGTNLLTGNLGAKPITPENAASTFTSAVETPTWYNWEEYVRPAVKEEYAGPGYWGSARPRAVAESAGDVGRNLSEQKANWMWNAEDVNRSIEENKAGRALSALGAVPQSLLNWTSGLGETGRYVNQILNQITDPQVLEVLDTYLTNPAGTVVSRGTTTPSQWDQWQAQGKAGAGIIAGLKTPAVYF